jgi:hypothetical protein
MKEDARRKEDKGRSRKMKEGMKGVKEEGGEREG